jgi:glutathione synthase/RimK-type ligase-like ATP-grasp enzyme
MKISKRLPLIDEFLSESKKDTRIQFIKVDPVKSGTDNEKMKKLTEDARDRFFEVFLQDDYGDILTLTEKMDLSRPMLVYAGAKSKDTEKFVMEVFDKNPKMIYNIPKEMKRCGSKVEFHKIFDKSIYVPKTVFKIEETGSLKWPIIAKPAEGHSGIGIEKFERVEDLKSSKNKFDLYSEFVDFDREYRVLCVKDNPIILYERQLIEEDDKSIETKKADEKVSFVYIDQDMDKTPFKKDLEKIIKEFRTEIPLDVYSLDFFLDKKNNLIVIEANSCSGLGANSLVHVYEAMYEDFYGTSMPGNDAAFIAKTKKEYRQIVAEDYPKEYKKSLTPKDI